MTVHLIFRGAHAARVWDLAVLRASAACQRALAERVVAEIQASKGPLRDLEWPEPELPPLGSLSEAIVDYLMLVREVTGPNGTTRPGLKATSGPAPSGGWLLDRTPDYATWRYFLDGELAFGIEWTSDGPSR